MARFNLFEGSRRIALLLKVAWVIGVAAITYSTSPYASLRFVTWSPVDTFHRTTDDCQIGTDAMEFVTHSIGDGKSVSAQLCFKAQLFESRLLVPYKDENGKLWGHERHSTAVTAYTKGRADQFALSENDRETGLIEWRRQSHENLRNGILFAIGGWIVLSVIQALIGWIVRGFMGVPWGQDRRPDPPRAPGSIAP